MASMPAEAAREPKLPTGLAEKHTARRLIVVLEQASLETVKTKKGYELLNCDDHQGLHKKAGRDPAESRPDISHQLLLALLDSPLNKAGLLQVYIQTKKNVLIEVNPHLRIPRTFKRFAGLMGECLVASSPRGCPCRIFLARALVHHFCCAPHCCPRALTYRLGWPARTAPKMWRGLQCNFCTS
jgi:hypothetical protein